MPRPALNRLSHASLQAAAQWYVRLHDPERDEQEYRHWQAWLEQHVEHRDAWHYVERVSQRFAPLQAEETQQAASQALRSRRGPTRRQTLAGLLIAGSAGLLGWSNGRTGPLPRTWASLTADLATGTGKTLHTRLSDGSQLWLNALSAVDQQFDAQQRLLQLRFGELLVDTARDPRPLRVATADGLLRALGTRFSVRCEPTHSLLNVYAGAVEVRTADRGQIEVVDAGSQLRFTRNSVGPLQTVSPTRESWSRGLLQAEGLPLGELIAELASYRQGHLGCAPALAHLPVLGTFPLNDSDRALALLQAALPIRVERLTDWWVSIEPRG